MLWWWAIPAVAACPEVAPAPGDAPVDALQTAVVAAIAAEDPDALFARWSPAMRDAVPLEATRGLVTGLHAAGGCLTAVERLSGTTTHGTWRLTAERAVWQLELTGDPAGEVVLGLKLGEPPRSDPPVASTNLALRLPFDGTWLVVWGGATREQNAHVDHPSQRRAVDLLQVGDDGRTHTGDGAALTDYHCYGEVVRAAADGTVLTVIDGVPDSAPGVVNPYAAVGNAVILSHPGGEHSVYAHLQPGSVKVKVGRPVRAGQVLGLVGNSGNSTEPHLHFQLQDGPRVESSWGIEAIFPAVTVTRDGATSAVTDYRFTKGDLVSP